MDFRAIYEKYRAKLTREGILKAVICGLIIGFAVNFAVAFVTWFTEFNGLWIALGLWLLVSAVAIPLFYKYVFRPTEKSIATRLDKLGFDERFITMYEYKDDESYIAKRQREDTVSTAVAAEKKSGGRLLSFKISVAVIVAVCVVGVFGLAMSVVTGLSGYGIIPNGVQVWGDVFPTTPASYSVVYTVSEGGELSGAANQKVESGKSSSEVVVTALDGYVFDRWEDADGQTRGTLASRHDDNVRADIWLKAVFVPLDPDKDDDDPGLESPDSNNNNSPSNDPSNGGGGGGGNSIVINDNIIDGKTHYKENYIYYYEMAMKELAESGDISPELREMIESYFNILL